MADWHVAVSLASFHVLNLEVVRERFDYDDARGIHVAFVRVFRLLPDWTFPDEPHYGGCRSWVNLPKLQQDVTMQPVLADEAHASVLARFRAVLGAQA
ncbi:hypothetical protein BH18VER1_BH18VER1_01010 [soil metagenome]